jgi:hypothetical protein
MYWKPSGYLFTWLITHKGSYPKAPFVFLQLPDYSLNYLVLKLHGCMLLGYHQSATNLRVILGV